MTKFLDLDALVSDSKSIKLFGREFNIPEPSFGQFAKLVKIQQDADESGDELKSLEAAKDLIKTLVPDLSDDDINALTLSQLKALIDFIIDDVQSDVGIEGK